MGCIHELVVAEVEANEYTSTALGKSRRGVGSERPLIRRSPIAFVSRPQRSAMRAV